MRNALSLISAEETRPVDQPRQTDPTLDADLVLYILPARADPADRRLLATLPPESTLVILNKADTLAPRWSDAATAADTLTTELGLLTLPFIADLAVHTRTGALTDPDLRTLRRLLAHPDPRRLLSHDLFADPAGPDAEHRRALLDRWDLHGISCALTALHHDPTLTPPALLQILHCASGIEPLHRELQHRYEATAARLRHR